MKYKKDSLEWHVENLQELFKLKDWEISVLYTKTGNNDAKVCSTFNDYEAEIQIRDALDEEEQLKCLVHEFCHIILRDTQDLLYDWSEGGKTTVKLMERENERLSKGIYKMYINYIQRDK